MSPQNAQCELSQVRAARSTRSILSLASRRSSASEVAIIVPVPWPNAIASCSLTVSIGADMACLSVVTRLNCQDVLPAHATPELAQRNAGARCLTEHA